MLIGTQIQKKSTFRSKISVPVSFRRRPPIKKYHKITFYIRNDYRREYLKHIACLLRNNRFQKKSILQVKTCSARQPTITTSYQKLSKKNLFLELFFAQKLTIAVMIGSIFLCIAKSQISEKETQRSKLGVPVS